MLTFERANELFKYEPETGMLIRKVTTGNNRFHAGTAAGCSSPDGYLRVRIDKICTRSTGYAIYSPTEVFPTICR